MKYAIVFIWLVVVGCQQSEMVGEEYGSSDSIDDDSYIDTDSDGEFDTNEFDTNSSTLPRRESEEESTQSETVQDTEEWIADSESDSETEDRKNDTFTEEEVTDSDSDSGTIDEDTTEFVEVDSETDSDSDSDSGSDSISSDSGIDIGDVDTGCVDDQGCDTGYKGDSSVDSGTVYIGYDSDTGESDDSGTESDTTDTANETEDTETIDTEAVDSETIDTETVDTETVDTAPAYECEEWDINTEYQRGDTVSYNGNFYMCKRNCNSPVSGSIQPPDVVELYWEEKTGCVVNPYFNLIGEANNVVDCGGGVYDVDKWFADGVSVCWMNPTPDVCVTFEQYVYGDSEFGSYKDEYCQSLNVGGNTDWRAATRHEVEGLFTPSYIDPVPHPCSESQWCNRVFTNEIRGVWESDGGTYRKIRYFDTGELYNAPETFSMPMLCVRDIVW